MRRLHHGTSIISLLLLALALAASPAAAALHVVNVTNNQFVPRNLTIATGDSVRWQWVAGSHTTTSGTAPPGNGLWNANMTSGNPQFTRRFTTSGTFPYFCSPHFSVGMTGSIVAQNRPPVINNIGTQNGSEGTFFTVTVSATNPNGDGLTMSDAGSHPSWSTFTDNGNRSCTFQGTPPFNAAGTYNAIVLAQDPGGLRDTLLFNIVIANVNQPPVVTNPGTQNGEEGLPFSVVVSAADGDGQALTLSDLGTHPAWATFTDNGNNTATIQGTPPFGSGGNYPVSVRATDPLSASDTENFSIAIGTTGAMVVGVQGADEEAGHPGHGAQGAGSLFPYGFVPPLVTIDVGEEVAWNWIEGSHTTTSGSSSDPMHNPGALWDVSITSATPIYFRQFNEPGVYDYFCRPHESAGMKGRIIVRATTGVGDDVAAGSVRGLRAYPNPFRATVDVVFRLTEAQEVGIEVYDLLGQRVRRVAAGTMPAGDHVVRWDGADDAGRGAAAGVYFIHIQTAQGVSSSKIFKIR